MKYRKKPIDLTEEQIIAEGRVANAQTRALVQIIERRDKEIEGLRREIQAWENSARTCQEVAFKGDGWQTRCLLPPDHKGPHYNPASRIDNAPHGESKLRALVETLCSSWENTQSDQTGWFKPHEMARPLRAILLADSPPDEPAPIDPAVVERLRMDLAAAQADKSAITRVTTSNLRTALSWIAARSAHLAPQRLLCDEGDCKNLATVGTTCGLHPKVTFAPQEEKAVEPCRKWFEIGDNHQEECQLQKGHSGHCNRAKNIQPSPVSAREKAEIVSGFEKNVDQYRWKLRDLLGEEQAHTIAMYVLHQIMAFDARKETDHERD